MSLTRQQSLLKEVKQNKAKLLKLLENRSFISDLWPGEANFVLIRVSEAEELLSFCAARDVILVYLMRRAPMMRIRGHVDHVTFEFYAESGRPNEGPPDIQLTRPRVAPQRFH